MSILFSKKIVFVLQSLEMGGAERQVCYLARHLLHDMNADVEVWSFSEPKMGSDELTRFKIPWRIISLPVKSVRFFHFSIFNNYFSIILNSLWLSVLLRNAGTDIVMPYLTYPNLLCGLAWKYSKAKVCIWNQRNGRYEHLNKRLEARAIRHVSHIISNSDQGANELEKRFNLCSERISIIPNGVLMPLPKRNRKEWRDSIGISNDAVVLTMLASFRGQKDHVTLFHAFQKARDRLRGMGKRIHLALGGRLTGYCNDLRELSVLLGIDGHVSFLGNVSDVSGLLAASDMGVLLSRFEGCPNAVLECMAMGLAVAGSDIPGIRDVLGPENKELLVPDGDARRLADIIVELSLDEKHRNDIGIRNRKRAESEFSMELLQTNTVSIIEKLLKG